MQFSFRHILFNAGILVFFISFLFFGRRQDIYGYLVTSGFVVSLIAFLFILVKDRKRSKLIWLSVFVSIVLIEQIIEPVLIKFSFQILLNTNKEAFQGVNNILLGKANFIYYDKRRLDTSSGFTSGEKIKINQLLTRTGVISISKDSDKIYYETFGFLDARIGIFYFFQNTTPPDRFQKIRDAWYY